MDQLPQPPSGQQEKSISPDERNQKIRDTLLKLTNLLGREYGHTVQPEIVQHSDYLKAKYPDCKRRSIYHAFIGSSIGKSDLIIDEDFPGDDSVVKFVEYLVEKYKK